jgi:hypothetical protein
MNDAVLSWRLLKENGIMIFDDYEWGIHTLDEKQKPKTGINAFLYGCIGHYKNLACGGQIIIQKLAYRYSEEELKANYR